MSPFCFSVRKWIASHGAERIGISADPQALLRECFRRGFADDEYYLGCIDPTELIEELASFPIRAKNDAIVVLVDQILAMHKKLASAKAPHDKSVLQVQLDATDRQIDRLVYELYGLTEDEIKIVEG